jgi:cysteinyl-tRNA synthetase
MAKYWMHNGLMQASDEVGKVGGRSTKPMDGDLAAQEAGKISKSKGSAPFRELLKKFPPEVIRFFLLSTHYRRPIDYSETRIKEVETGMETFYRFFKRFERIVGESYYNIKPNTTRPEVRNESQHSDFEHAGEGIRLIMTKCFVRFLESMDDDFNTGGAIAALFDLVRSLNKFADDKKLDEPAKRNPADLDDLNICTKRLRELALALGLFRKPAEEKAATDDGLTPKLMQLLIELRAEARKKKDFATADRIRTGLTEIGVTLEDRPGGTEWSAK